MRTVAVKRFERCSACAGGALPVKKCGMCCGNGRVQKEVLVDVTFAAGVHSNWNRVFQGLGDDHVDAGCGAGDLIVTITVEDHPFFRRIGNDVHAELCVSFVQATLGCKLRIPSLYGTAMVTVPSGTQPNAVIPLAEEGFVIPVLNTKGVMVLTLKVITPCGLTSEEVSLLGQFHQLYKDRIAKGLPNTK